MRFRATLEMMFAIEMLFLYGSALVRQTRSSTNSGHWEEPCDGATPAEVQPRQFDFKAFTVVVDKSRELRKRVLETKKKIVS